MFTVIYVIRKVYKRTYFSSTVPNVITIFVGTVSGRTAYLSPGARPSIVWPNLVTISTLSPKPIPTLHRRPAICAGEYYYFIILIPM